MVVEIDDGDESSSSEGLYVVEGPPPTVRIGGDAPPAEEAASAGTSVTLECAVCLENVREPTSTTCGHIYCQPCIRRAIQKTKMCPLCRKPHDLRSLIRLYLPTSID